MLTKFNSDLRSATRQHSSVNKYEEMWICYDSAYNSVPSFLYCFDKFSIASNGFCFAFIAINIWLSSLSNCYHSRATHNIKSQNIQYNLIRNIQLEMKLTIYKWTISTAQNLSFMLLYNRICSFRRLNFGHQHSTTNDNPRCMFRKKCVLNK